MLRRIASGVYEFLRDVVLFYYWLLGLILGGETWTPPPWIAEPLSLARQGVLRGGAKLHSWRNARPKTFFGTVIALCAIGAGSWYGWQWWENRPKPVEFSVSATAPDITPLIDDAKPNPVVIEFGGSAAPLELVGKEVKEGKDTLTLEPKMAGKWVFETDSKLVFTPAEEWAVGEEYTVEIAESLFPKHVLLKKYEVKFSTAPFSIRIAGAEFFNDPTDPKVKRVLATLKASHAFAAEEIKSRILLEKTIRKNDKWVKSDDKIPFTLTFDKFMGEAYIVSENIPIPLDDMRVDVILKPGLKAARGGKGFDDRLETSVDVPSMYSYFRVSGSEIAVVRNDKWESEYALVISTSAVALTAEVARALEVHELPKDRPATKGQEAQANYGWSSPDEIGPEILKLSRRLEVTPIPSEREYVNVHSFKIKTEPGKHLFIHVKKGIKAYGDYVLAHDFETVEHVQALPQEVILMHQGSILSVSGSQKLSVLARDVPAVKFELGRVQPADINHLISQTNGTFQRPSFNGYSFNQDNIVERFEEVQPLRDDLPGKAQFTNFDFTKYVKAGGKTGERRGLFFLKASGWELPQEQEDKATGSEKAKGRYTGAQDERFILVTDLGLVVKAATDGSQSLFVMSFRTGKPEAGAHVQVLGKNGVPIVETDTDGGGRAALPDLSGFSREKEPVVYLVTKGQDLTFLPIGRGDRFLNLSRFETGGDASGSADGALEAYLFTDRGIYRPGDTFQVGVIVKDTTWRRTLTGIPVEIGITDPRGMTVAKTRIALGSEGFENISHTTLDTSPTGEYTVTAYIVTEKGFRGAALGSTQARVEEFLPDRMRIASHFSATNADGWVSPADLQASVSLNNLFGKPATDRRIVAAFTLTPWSPSLRGYADWQFFDPLYAKNNYGETLSEQRTNDAGEATFDLDLKRFTDATYRVVFTADGFEAEGGRAVTTQSSILVSSNPWLIGTKADGRMASLKRGAERYVDVIAVDPGLKKVEVDGLKAELIELKFVSVLTKQPSGIFKYESVQKEVSLESAPLKVLALGTRLKVKTSTAGSYALLIKDGEGRLLNRSDYSVAGEANLSRNLERNAELEIKLDKADYDGGDTVQISIVAPYTGAGLITIEKEKVYASKWFNASTTASVQTIEVPKDLEGNGYVNVTFVRDMGSPEVYMSPLSYGVVPFSVSRERRTNPITLHVADLVLPGKPLAITFKTAKPSKIAIFAVDEGILQVARYRTPDPLAAFFRKRALAVRTSQILDLLLPEFELVHQLSAPGGDADASIGANLNPFKRKRKAPVAFWSGIIDAGPDEREVVYDVPDYFNGTLRVMAVAVQEASVGVARTQTIVRGPFVLSPNVPTFVAPGDEFIVSVAVANNVVGSGKEADVEVTLATSKHLQVLDEPKRTLKISENTEQATTFKVKALEELGSGTLSFAASRDKVGAKASEDLSVRPAAPYRTQVVTGTFKDKSVEVPVARKMHAEYRTLEAAVSYLPLGMARGLGRYLETYPYGCTEQMVSKAFPPLILGRRPEFHYDAKDLETQFDNAIAILRSRQTQDGAFGYWAANSYSSPFISIYASHFLIEAKERGRAVPQDLFDGAVDHLKQLVTARPSALYEARQNAYALYLLTRSGLVTANYLDGLLAVLEENFPDIWKGDLTGAYVAATYQLLQKTSEADSLIRKVKFGKSGDQDYNHFYDGFYQDGMLLYVLSKHFRERVKDVSAEDIDHIVQPIAKGSFNTYTSAIAILALDAYADTMTASKDARTRIFEILTDKKERPLELMDGIVRIAPFTDLATAVKFTAEDAGSQYYQTTESGFDVALPKEPIKDQLEIYREFKDADGKPVTKVTMGQVVTVNLKIRGIKGNTYENVAVIDLLPAGFEVELQRLEEDRNTEQVETSPEGQRQSEESGDGEGGGEGQNDGTSEDEGESDEPAAYNYDAASSWRSPSVRLDGGTSSFQPNYADIREDRVVLYGAVSSDVTEFNYKVRAVSRGTFKVPPIFAESMYDRGVRALSLGGEMTVEDAP